MSALFDELEKQARLLTPQEKATLAHTLIEELDPSVDSEVEQIWIAEAQRRYQAYLKGQDLAAAVLIAQLEIAFWSSATMHDISQMLGDNASRAMLVARKTRKLNLHGCIRRASQRNTPEAPPRGLLW